MDEEEDISRLNLYEKRIVLDRAKRLLWRHRWSKVRFLLIRLPLVLCSLLAIYGAFRYRQATLKFPEIFNRYPDVSPLRVYGGVIAVCSITVAMFRIDGDCINSILHLLLIRFLLLFSCRRNSQDDLVDHS